MATNQPLASGLLQEKILNLMTVGEKEIRERLHFALSQQWLAEGLERGECFARKKAEGTLFSVFITLLSGGADIDGVQLPCFPGDTTTFQPCFFSDLISALSCFESILADYFSGFDTWKEGELLNAFCLIHRLSFQLLERSRKEKSEILEYVVERGEKGFCHIDPGGRIIRHNKKMGVLAGRPTIEGMKLESFFKNQDEIDFIRKVVERPTDSSPGFRKMHLVSGDAEKIKPVRAEIGSIIINDRSYGSYACFADISVFEKETMQVLDRSPLGILKASLSGEINYINRELLQILGITEWKGKTIKDILGDGEAWQTIKRGLERRKMGLSDEYPVDIPRPDGQTVPIMISSAPETDSKGMPTGAMAIVRSLEKEKVIAAMNQHINQEKNWETLLEKVAKEIRQLVPYDRAIFRQYSDDGIHSRELFQWPQTEKIEWSIRWRETSEGRRLWLRQDKPIIGNIDEFLMRDECQELRQDPEIKKFLASGVRSFIFLPIFKAEMMAASMILCSNDEGAFDGIKEQLLKDLPIDAALKMVLYFQAHEEFVFRTKLLNDLSSASNDINKASKLVVEEIGTHYQWDNVSLFSVDIDQKRVVLEHQFASSESFRLPSDYSQQLSEGLLGLVVDKGEMVCVPDQDDENFKNICVKALKNTGSEICLPIQLSGNVHWLLNIEDSQRNAFSKENQIALKEIVGELKGLLSKARNRYFLEALLENASDGILTVDEKGKIMKVNPAWSELLGYSKEQILGTDAMKMFADPEKSAALLRSKPMPNRKIVLRHYDGREVEVLLSISNLPKKLSGKVLIAKDLAPIKRMAHLEALEETYYEFAVQTKTPLSLAFTWLYKLKQETGGANGRIDDILRQLKRVDLTFDRLAFHGTDERGVLPKHYLLSLKEVIERVLDDVSKRDREQVAVEYGDALPLVRGDLYQLYFCLQSNLSYLLRFLPENRTIRWHTWRQDGDLFSEIEGYFPSQGSNRPDDIEKSYQISKTLFEMATGTALSKRFLEQHGGRMHDPKIEDETMALRIQLPIPEEG